LLTLDALQSFCIPKFGESEHSFILSKNLDLLILLLFQSNYITPALCFGQFHIEDAISKGIFHLPVDAALKLRYFQCVSQCLSNRMAKVSKLLDKTHALNGDNEGPVG
jgi:hypothetical protein